MGGSDGRSQLRCDLPSTMTLQQVQQVPDMAPVWNVTNITAIFFILCLNVSFYLFFLPSFAVFSFVCFFIIEAANLDSSDDSIRRKQKRWPQHTVQEKKKDLEKNIYIGTIVCENKNMSYLICMAK